MDTPLTDKKDCITAAIEITKAFAGAGNAPPGALPDLVEKLYLKLVELMKKAENS